MTAGKERDPRIRRFPQWPRSRPVRAARFVLINFLLMPMFRGAYGVETRGLERLLATQEPYLLISNHNMHLDQAVILMSMPRDVRRKVAIAAAASDIFGNPVRGFLSALVGNAFPFSKEGSGVRDSLEYVGYMLESGWNILFFPEGRLTVGGPMRRFKFGVSRIAADTGVPVVPIRIDIVRPGFREGRWFPTPRALVVVNYGEAVRIEQGASYVDATARLEAAVTGA